jgi:hypothetical protein
VVNAVAVVWVAFMLVLLSLPPNETAGMAFGVTCVVLLFAWFAGVRTRFKGPATMPLG